MDATIGSLAASVVIPVRGRSDDLRKCLEKLVEQTVPADQFEILVCDDGSQPRDSDAIRAACAMDSRIRYLKQPPRGPAAARNLGIGCARAPIVAFTDSDTLPTPGWLEALLAPFADPAIVGVEGPVRTPEAATSPLQEAPRNETGGVFLTANMAYRRSALLQVGGLDESFPLPAFEDVDLALCVRGLGKYAFAAQALVLHPWRKITLQSSVRRLRQFDWLLLTALRHGCLGWADRPTKYARYRIALAAAITLPLGRMRKGASYLFSNPRDGLQRIGISFIEAAIGLLMVPRFLRRAYPTERRRYLEPAMAGAAA
ncbi:MAG TPA: glycosyltransferase family A protein [Planctomycetia bacterium]|nr:glycosyltransferase family A protein [Planctomycetia bacterium]